MEEMRPIGDGLVGFRFFRVYLARRKPDVFDPFAGPFFEPVVASLFYAHYWNPGEWFEAECHLCRDLRARGCTWEQQLLGVSCSGQVELMHGRSHAIGFYAYNDPWVAIDDFAKTYTKFAFQGPTEGFFVLFGLIELAGTVVVGEAGYRAEQAAFAAFLGPDPRAVWKIDPDTLKAVEMEWPYDEWPVVPLPGFDFLAELEEAVRKSKFWRIRP